MPIALEAFCAHTGFEVAVLLMKNPDRDGLRLRAHAGRKLPESLLHADIAYEGNTLLEKLSAKEATFHFIPEKHATTVSGVPEKLLGGSEGFFQSIHAGGKSIGVIMACRRKDAGATDRDLKICRRIGRSVLEVCNRRKT